MIHLHVHTDYSFLDGSGKVEELVLRAKEFGQSAIAVTDHGNMCGMYDLYKACTKHNIQPIYAIEFYHVVEGIDKRMHLCAYAKSMRGLKNLYKLHEISYKQQVKGAFNKCFPVITYSDLFKFKEDVVISTACMAGHVPYLIQTNQYNELYITIELLKKQFNDDFYFEVQANSIPEQEHINSELIRLGKLYNVKCIATNDVHYTYQDDAKVQEVLLCIQTKNKMSNENRFKFSTNDFWLKSDEEMMNTLTGISEEDKRIALSNTLEVASKCKFDLEIPKQDEVLPKFASDENLTLRELVNKGWRTKRHNRTQVEIERVKHELNIIEQKGYSGYYLIVADYINYAKANNVLVGQGRGSGVGSFVAYLIGMTDINPIEHGLLFERFLNPERKSSPDLLKSRVA